MTFTKEQIAYLESLPAVDHAGRQRITYSDAFRRDCLARYRSGERPTALFREAGLDPKLIGYKRIERCFARWREQAEQEDAARRSDGTEADSGTDSGFGSGAGSRGGADEPTNRTDHWGDPRDAIIARQALLIDELEHEIEELRHDDATPGRRRG